MVLITKQAIAKPNPKIETNILKLFDNHITARVFYVIFSCPIMVVEEVMFAYETLQRSRRLLSVEPCITVLKPRSCFGLQCSKLSKTTGLVDFENIPATSEIKISKKDRTESVKTTAVLNLVMFKPGLKMRRKKFAKGREREREQTGYIREQNRKKCGNRE